MVKIGIIGAGRIGKVHLKSLSYFVHDAQVTAVADPFMNEDTEKLVKSYGVKNVYTDYRKIIEDPDIDAVFICSSTDTHASISVEAINTGKHVFCEKPIDHTTEKIADVQAALDKHPVKFQVGFNRRFDHNFAAIRAAVDEGKIGQPHIVKITSRDPEPPRPEYIAVSGGMFLDMTIHDFDMASFLVNSDIEEVYVESAVLVDPAIGEQGDVDTAIITMKMSDGALVVIDNSRKAAYGYDQRAEVFGSKGTVMTTNDKLSSAVVADKNGITGEKPLYFFLERYMESFSTEEQAFVKAIEDNTDTPVSIHEGLMAVKAGLAAKLSVKEHRPVKISEIK